MDIKTEIQEKETQSVFPGFKPVAPGTVAKELATSVFYDKKKLLGKEITFSIVMYGENNFGDPAILVKESGSHRVQELSISNSLHNDLLNFISPNYDEWKDVSITLTGEEFPYKDNAGNPQVGVSVKLVSVKIQN